MFRFEKLDVWDKSVDFADRVHAATRTFPIEERFGLTSQLRRASVSISSNIAEGSARSSDKDFVHFHQIAYSSLLEVLSQAQVAIRQAHLDVEQRDDLYERGEELACMLSGLKRSLQ